ncbi:DUF2142 domain-containing protein [Clostridium neonatale]|uniref:DUF2142 domain-containing protein n=1 Tax=Clostridium neonatale TaxID=137838 RepID=A0A2A7MLA5_9CLOT|nr:MULTISPECIES: DUF2142 domain-containing protein [Clostridium]MDU4847376.1 DUF2142 domain-containing protein [Clostridium sp.]PEG28445.1 DUF2142 domain-containing protein [Clostridium neonatale]PEG32592.1 DUF2142 domain-containing protein [Clostridium neonatale]CAH0438852.1 Putative membrane protein, DUF2142 [Clostridium neonatale]
MSIINNKLHYWFLNIALILGLILIIFGPPMTIPDEQAHFLNAYSIADGQIILKNENGNIGKYFPENIVKFANDNFDKYVGLDSEKYKFKEYYYNSYLPNSVEQKEIFYSYFNQDITPIAYIFSSLGIFVGKLLLPSSYELPFNLLIFARTFNFVFYIISIFYAIKITPYYKNTMFMLALMPMSIYLGASISYDCLLIPSTFLLVAQILKIRNQKEIYISDIVRIFFLIFMLSCLKKSAYLPFVLVLFSIPIKMFDNSKKYCKIICLATIIAIIGIIIGRVNSIIGNGFIVNDNKIELQKQYLESNLGLMIPLIRNSFIKYKLFYFTSFIGVLGQLDTNFPLVLLLIFALILIYTIIMDGIECKLIIRKFKVFTIISIIVFIYFTFRSMYINWTPLVEDMYGNFVSGIQGRYFIPLSMFAAVLFSTNAIKVKNNKLANINEIISIYSIIIMSVIMVITLITRYWI